MSTVSLTGTTKLLSALLVILVLTIIELPLVVIKYTIIYLGRNPFCGGLLGFLPTCPLTSLLAGIWQPWGGSCLSGWACKPGVDCTGGTCGSTDTGRETPITYAPNIGDPPPVYNPEMDYAGWCSVDTDCRNGTLVNPAADTDIPYGLCVSGRCRNLMVRYSSVPVLNAINSSCNVLSCPPGTCVCISSRSMTYVNGLVAAGRAEIQPGTQGQGLIHAPLGLSLESVGNAVIGFNSETRKGPRYDINYLQKRARLTITFLVISFILLCLALVFRDRTISIPLFIGALVFQILFFTFLFSNWRKGLLG